MDRSHLPSPMSEEVKQAVAKAEENAKLAAQAGTNKDRDYYERMRRKWLGIADGWRGHNCTNLSILQPITRLSRLNQIHDQRRRCTAGQNRSLSQFPGLLGTCSIKSNPNTAFLDTPRRQLQVHSSLRSRTMSQNSHSCSSQGSGLRSASGSIRDCLPE